MEKLVLIDGNSLLNRAFYATPLFTTKDGTPTNGVFGFIKLMLKIISDKKPTYFAVAFDVHAPTFRHKVYSDYKAGRKPMPTELAAQFPILKELLSLMQIKVCELPGYEADDLLGTLAKRFPVQTYIYTGDRDAYQLVDETTTVCFTKKGVSDLLELTKDNFKDEIGLTPAQIIDFKALMGDKSDNIPGVAGVGEKTAMGLLYDYKTLEGAYEHIDEIKGALQTKLITNKENAFFSKQLATINIDAPIDTKLSECVLSFPFSSAVKDKFVELEFKSLVGMNIFADSVAVEGEQTSKSQGKITEEFPETIAEIVEKLNDNSVQSIAVDCTDTEIRMVILTDDYKPTDALTEYVFPLKMGLLDPGYFDYQLLPIFKRVFQDNLRVIAYDIKKTMRFLSQCGVKITAKYDDVSVLKCLSDGLSNSDGLQYCIDYYALQEKCKAAAVAWLKHYYFNTLNQKEKSLYNEVELPLIAVLYDMEKQGVCVNEKELDLLSVRYSEERKRLTEEIYRLAGEEFNVNSTQQLGKILFEKLRIGGGVKKLKDGKKYKTTAEELEKYADESEIVRLILRYRKVQKLASTYIDGFKPLINQGKIHTTYNQTLTATGRLSSSNPNLQNIPIRTEEGKELRKLFKASKDCVLLDADYSQIELRLLAHFSGCKELIEAYCEERDIHKLTASQVFGVTLDSVTSDMRRQAKAVNFGIIYGISAFGLANDLGISARRAQEYIQKYFELYSDVKSYMDKNVSDCAKDGFVTTLLGRRRVINEIHASNHNIRGFGERAAMNMPLQGTSADIIKIAMINVAKKLKEGGYQAKLVLQVHDELLIDCPITEVEPVSKLLKEEMENAVSLKVPLTVEVGVGETWFKAKE